MPSQTAKATAVYYVEGDTAPPLTATLVDGDGNAIDLTGCTVRIIAAFAMPRGSYYTSPRRRIVDDPNVAITDPTNGKVSWTPGTTEGVDKLTPPGEFLYQFQVTYPDSTVQTVPANTYLPMIIKTPVGGRG